MANTAYDQFKEHEGRRYTGVKVGRGHKWRYDAGDWTEKKVTPDKWNSDHPRRVTARSTSGTSQALCDAAQASEVRARSRRGGGALNGTSAVSAPYFIRNVESKAGSG